MAQIVDCYISHLKSGLSSDYYVCMYLINENITRYLHVIVMGSNHKKIYALWHVTLVANIHIKKCLLNNVNYKNTLGFSKYCIASTE